jgi:predicted esterase
LIESLERESAIHFLTLWLMFLCAVSAGAQTKPSIYQPQRDSSRVPRQPYTRYLTHDRFDREITFYLSESDRPDPQPLIVFIQGSGCGSLFNRQGSTVVPAMGHITIQEAARNQARVFIVEKPGVRFLDQPQTPEERAGSPEFRREHTLERWAEAVEAAIRAARKLPEIKPDQVMVIGHSEGGLVACRVTRELSDIATHVAILAGGGPSQLFDLVSLARKGNFFRETSEQPEVRVKYVFDQWGRIQADPLSTEKLFFGFAYRRWSTFLTASPIEELAPVRSAIYVAQGTDDDAVDPITADMLVADLRAHGKTVTYDRVEGADHSFNLKGSPAFDGWREEMQRIVKWFLPTKVVKG